MDKPFEINEIIKEKPEIANPISKKIPWCSFIEKIW
jgi:hypothetical protein